MELEESVATELREDLLSERLAAGPLPVQDALRYAIEIASTLQKLHECGRTHGTLSASSIVLIDGRAAVREPEAEESHDPRDDIAAFGSLLREMLTGATPGTAGAQTVPDGLQHVVATCTERNPNQRYQRMRTVVMELKLSGFAEQRQSAGATDVRQEIARLGQKVVEIQAAVQAFQEQVESLLCSAMVEVREEVEANRKAVRAMEAASVEQFGKLAQAQMAMETGMCQNEALLSRTLEEIEALQERVPAA